MTRHCWRTRWEHSKSAILLDDDARHDPRSPCVFGAQQHVCKRLSLLPKYITTDRDRVRPKVNDKIGKWSILFERNIRDTLFFIWRSVHWRSHIYKAFFFRLCYGLFVFWLVESSHLQRHKLKDPMVIGRRLFSGTFLSLCLACT